MNVTLRPGEWTAAVAGLLSAAVDHKTAHLIDLEGQVRAGVASVVEVLDDAGALVGAVVLRVDHLASGAQGVIVAAAGQLAGARLMSLLPHLEARFQGVRSVRVHTSRRGVMRALTRAGYQPQELIFVKPCSATA